MDSQLKSQKLHYYIQLLCRPVISGVVAFADESDQTLKRKESESVLRNKHTIIFFTFLENIGVYKLFFFPQKDITIISKFRILH